MEKQLMKEIQLVLPEFTERDLRRLRRGEYCNNKKQLNEILSTFTAKRDGKITTFKDGIPKFFLPNDRNSCAPDSILFILFFTYGSYFMDRILNYSSKPKWVKQRAFRDEIIEPLTKLYNNMTLWTKSITKIQKILGKYTNISCNDVKSGTEIWGLLASAFPGLDFPLLTKDEEAIGNTFTSAAYIDPEMYQLDDLVSLYKSSRNSSTSSSNGSSITENNSRAKHIVFGDDRRPGNRRLDQGMDGLESVLFFIGQGHYTAAVKGSNGTWYYYDDLRPNVLIIKDPASFIFDENINKKIQMLFYIR